MSRQFKSTDTSLWPYGFGNAADGSLTISSNTTYSPIDASCSGTSGTYSLSATNASFAAGQAIFISKVTGNTTTNAGSWELNFIASYSSGTITTTLPLQYTYNDSGSDQSQVIVIKQLYDFTVNGSTTLTCKNWDGNVGGVIPLLVKNSATITGSITATGKGYRGGSTSPQGNGGSGQQYGYAGEGSTGGYNANQYTANGNGGGAGHRFQNGRAPGGGGGGYSAAGGIGNDTGDGSHSGIGGSIVGDAGLTSLFMGGAGGGGAPDWPSGSYGGAGGNGGGIILLISKNITITGSVSSNGNNGSNGVAPSGSAGGGGGGAGGSILIKCQNATLGTNLSTATKGAKGAAGNGVSVERAGGDGAAGRIHLDYKTSYTGTTNPTIDVTQDTSLNDQTMGGIFLYNFV